MYRTSTGEEIFVIDGHVHLWDASPENIRNKYGEGFINCFYDYHRNLSPEEYLWDRSVFARYGPEKMTRDLFVDGYVDMAIFQPTYLKEFFRQGFNTTEQNAVLKDMYPDRFILNGAFDPRDGEAGLEYLEALVEHYGIRGVKLYTAEWRGNSKGWKLTDPWAYRYLEKCEELGIKNIHVHKGPTIWPLNRDAFDVADVDEAASAFPNLNFIVEHCGIPRIDDFCWIATQEPNVYGGLAVVMPFIHSRPRYFAEVLANLLWWVGEDRLLFASDYAIWQPRWLVEKFMAFDFPEDIKEEFGFELTLDVKRKILGENAARLYGIDIEAQKQKLAHDPIGAGR
ncbi:amidohydrolase family protein [Hydrogenibacillus sp. N12]|uniref:amidohydrolase family protein n=1 Tax=Hydrogenibacillus sp. N12 TaxID=2866627 RepID=UPI001C7CB231|nr:amidohydrolase family protein [Hydrogenibacillus sp. N12]QZA32166.1 amidohydrolase [Hydrogenibacillus sp. N12]